MSLHAFREQSSSLVPRCKPPGSPPRIRTSPKRAIFTGSSSRVLAALDAEFASIGGPVQNRGFVGNRGNVVESLGSARRAHICEMPSPPLFDATFPHSPHPSVLEDSATNGMLTRPSAPAQPKAPRRARKARPVDDEITSYLPRYSYRDFSLSPARVFTANEEEADDLVGALNGPIAFDLEWRVMFRPNLIQRRVAIVQLSDHRMILVIQISSMKRFPVKVKEIIESPDVVKMGINIMGDGRKLFNDFGIIARNLVELSDLAKRADPKFPKIRMMSLAKITERYTGKYLHKGKERTSNWEAKLNNAQIEYAANDAHCALMVYDQLMTKAKKAKITLDASDYTKDINSEPKDISRTATLLDISSPVIRRNDSSSTTASSSTFDSTASFFSRANSISSTVITESEAEASELDTNTQSTCMLANRQESGVEVIPARPMQSRQHIRAYDLWHYEKTPLLDICANLRSKENPLKESTVISYVVRALQTDPELLFDYDRLIELIHMEAGSWQRHKDWVLQQKK